MEGVPGSPKLASRVVEDHWLLVRQSPVFTGGVALDKITNPQRPVKNSKNTLARLARSTERAGAQAISIER